MTTEMIAPTAAEETRAPWNPRLTLTPDEIRQIQSMLAELRKQYHHVEDPRFHEMAPVYAQELPRRVREAFARFRLYEPEEALLVVDGYPIDEEKLGPTPPHWKGYKERNSALEEEMLLVMLGSLLGTCIGWTTQQDGRIVHDILPIEEHKDEQLGSGSETLLWWHVEDAFHPLRGDYLGMGCLRNPDGVATTFCTLEDIELAPEHIDRLFEEHYTIRPDESHLVKNKADNRKVDDQLRHSYQEIHLMNERPPKLAVLFGDRKAPYLRLDPYFMDPVEDPAAQAALDALREAIDEKIGRQVLTQGCFCFIDNFQAVHGRLPFTARFDGTDRWIKRVNITRDLRKSRAARERPEVPIIL